MLYLRSTSLGGVQIKWTSEGLTSPVSLNLLTPEAAEAPDKKQKEDTSNDEDDDHDDYLPPETVEKEHQGNGGSDDDGDNDNDSDDDDDDNDVDNNNLGVGLVPEERTMKGRIVLESALPSAGFLLTNGGPEIMDMPAGDGYSIEVSTRRVLLHVFFFFEWKKERNVSLEENKNLYLHLYI